MDSTLNCSANSSAKNIVFYNFTYLDNCHYSKIFYEFDHWSIAEIYSKDSVLIATHNLYPYDTTISDYEYWNEAENPMLYRDTIIIQANITNL